MFDAQDNFELVEQQLKKIEQKSTDKVEPKFKVGDWIVDNCGYVWKIEGILNQFYILKDIEGGESRPTIEWTDKTFHLWTIQDAKDGDILISTKYNNPFIYNGNYNPSFVGSYCGISSDDRFIISTKKCFWTENMSIRPVTKEQRDLLFKKMKEAGYEWDSEKKELKKIEQKHAWSEEDEYMLDETIQHLEELIRIDKAKHCGVDVQYYQRDIDWLKSLKDRVQPQPKQEWSEEDDSNWNNIWDVLDGRFELSDYGYKEAAKWFLENCPKPSNLKY